MNLPAGGATRAHLKACFTRPISSPRRARINWRRNMPQKPAPMPESFQPGELQDVVVGDLRKFNDRRGWLCELFRNDEVASDFLPAMTYISSTNAGITRGPHEHVDQADLFCFIGPSNFKLRMWDNRPCSPTFRKVMTIVAGAGNPTAVVGPKGAGHAYQNAGTDDDIGSNFPDPLYRAQQR